MIKSDTNLKQTEDILLREKIGSLQQMETPASLHKKIMHQLFFYRFKIPILAGFCLLSASLFVSGWYLWNKIIESEMISIAQALLSNFELSFDFIADFLKTVSIVIPVNAALIFFINLSLIAYLVRYFSIFRQTFKKYAPNHII